MIDKTMCEVLWRNISDFYVNLRVEVAAVSRNRYGVEKTVDTRGGPRICGWGGGGGGAWVGEESGDRLRSPAGPG